MGGLSGKTITFPKTAKIVRDRAFNSTPLESVVLNEGLEVLEYAFSCTNIKKIAFPKTLKEIDSSTFSDCKNL